MIDGEPGFVLQPYDQVYVRKSPAYQKQVNVQVTGEVLYEGDYALTERIVAQSVTSFAIGPI